MQITHTQLLASDKFQYFFFLPQSIFIIRFDYKYVKINNYVVPFFFKLLFAQNIFFKKKKMITLLLNAREKISRKRYLI